MRSTAAGRARTQGELIFERAVEAVAVRLHLVDLVAERLKLAADSRLLDGADGLSHVGLLLGDLALAVRLWL